MKRLQLSNLLCLVLLLLGSLQMIGYLAKVPALRGLGAASAMSPCPKVFGTAPIQGEPGIKLETFSAEFELIYQVGHVEHSLEITPEIYARVLGPYNRRNVYGAALAYGPCLPPELMETLLSYALIKPGRLLPEIGIPSDATNLRIRIQGQTATGEPREWHLQPDTSNHPTS